VRLLMPRSLPRTSSGKIMRQESRTLFLKGMLTYADVEPNRQSTTVGLRN